MFIKIPVYFDIIGIVPSHLGFLQENLQVQLEKNLLGRAVKVQIEYTKEDLKKLGIDAKTKIFMIRRDKVLDDMR